MNRVLLYAAGVLLAAVVALGLLLRAEHRKVAEFARTAEAAKLEADGLAVARQASERQLRAEADAARAEVAGFAEALDRAQRAARARPVAVARSSTGPLPVEAGAAPGAPQAGAQRLTCALREDDHGQIDAVSEELRTEAGNKILVQAAQASRIDPDGSQHRLFGGELRADLTKYLSSETEPPASRGLGVGPLAICTAGGCSAGAAVAAPPLGRFELSGGAFAGRGGTGLEAQLLFRLP